MPNPSATMMDATFARLERIAIAGERCPMRDELTTAEAASIGLLARAGRIFVEIYNKNWRVVTLLTGQHKGKCTLACPTGGSPYLTVGVVTKRGGRIVVGNEKRSEPSAPRALSRAEVEKL